jgi:hypothetical protein
VPEDCIPPANCAGAHFTYYLHDPVIGHESGSPLRLSCLSLNMFVSLVYLLLGPFTSVACSLSVPNAFFTSSLFATVRDVRLPSIFASFLSSFVRVSRLTYHHVHYVIAPGFTWLTDDQRLGIGSVTRGVPSKGLRQPWFEFSTRDYVDILNFHKETKTHPQTPNA